MTKLDDMEELLLLVKDDEMREYMKEAHRCYSVGAFRGCIIMCFISTFHHLVARLETLAPNSKKAAEIYSEVKRKIEEQTVYETFLIEKTAKEGLIKEIDSFFLNLVRDLRNKSAHPSGHAPSAEEARMIYKETITRFLKEDIINHSYKIEDIISNLEHKHYIVTNNYQETKDFVRKETLGIPAEGIPMLCSQIFSLRKRNSSPIIRENTRTFLFGLAGHNDLQFSESLVRTILRKHLVDETETSLFLGILSCATANAYTLLDEIEVKRLVKHYKNYIASGEIPKSKNNVSHPSTIIASIIMNWPQEAQMLLDKEIRNQINEDFYHPKICKSCLESAIYREDYLRRLLAMAGSTDFSTANTCTRGVRQLDAVVASLVSNDQALILLAKVWRAADHGAFDAIDVRDTKFSGMPKISEKAREHLMEEKSSAASLFNEHAGTEMLWSDIIFAIDNNPNSDDNSDAEE